MREQEAVLRRGERTYEIDPGILDEADRLVSYWELHGDNPETVAKWAVDDLLGFLRYFAELD